MQRLPPGFHTIWTAFTAWLDRYTPTMPDGSPAEPERPVASRNLRTFGPALVIVVVVGKLFSAILDWPDPGDGFIVLGLLGLLACAYLALRSRFRRNDRSKSYHQEFGAPEAVEGDQRPGAGQ